MILSMIRIGAVDKVLEVGFVCLFSLRSEQNGKMWFPDAFAVTFSRCCCFMPTQMALLSLPKMLRSRLFTGLNAKQREEAGKTWVINMYIFNNSINCTSEMGIIKE